MTYKSQICQCAVEKMSLEESKLDNFDSVIVNIIFTFALFVGVIGFYLGSIRIIDTIRRWIGV